MSKQVAAHLTASQLQGYKKILYMSHLALGDYVYQGALLHQLHQDYPHLQIDVWFDDCRDYAKSWASGRNQVLSQWLENEPHIGSIYPIACSAEERQVAVERAKHSQYDAVIFFATVRSERFAAVALDIAGGCPAIGAYQTTGVKRFRNRRTFSKLTHKILLKPSAGFSHISAFYQYYFNQIVALQQPSRALLSLTVPDAYKAQALHCRTRFANDKSLIFINHLSTTEKRDWQVGQVIALIHLLCQSDNTLHVVINALPDAQPALNEALGKAGLDQQTQLFCAQSHFYELPAMMQQARLVISVETAVMHLAAALQIPCISLVRAKARQWQPLGPGRVLEAGKRIDSIGPEQVFNAAKAYLDA